jgi:hypothetical protein
MIKKRIVFSYIQRKCGGKNCTMVEERPFFGWLCLVRYGEGPAG